MGHFEVNKLLLVEELKAHFLQEIDAASPLGRAEFQRLYDVYRFLPLRNFGPADTIVPSALVELSLEGTRAFYFLAPAGGGLILSVDGKPVQVITAQSPLGECLLGKKQGDQVRVESRGSTRIYDVVEVS